jgi:DNA-binding MarR family transcriptional regulator
MNKKALPELDEYTLFRLFCELEGKQAFSQRELASRLNSALGLVNSYLKTAAGNGWIKIKELPANRCTYHLTPKGAEMRRTLALQHARYLDWIVSVLSDEYRVLCASLKDEGIERIALCGVDGVTNNAWLALEEAGIKVSMVMDSRSVGTRYMGHEVVSLPHAMLSGIRWIVISSRNRADELLHSLLELGAEPASIKVPLVFLEKINAA